MSIRLNEIHPSVVHFPLTLLPLAVLADALGKLTGRQRLNDMGRALMPIGAASAALAGGAGLLAQGTANATGEAKNMLMKHRTINMGLVGLMGTLAFKRRKMEQPSAGYLLAGLGGLALMSYTAYLGGRMVYEHGVGVKPAGGLRSERVPELHLDNIKLVANESARHITQAAREVAGDVRAGKVLRE